MAKIQIEPVRAKSALNLEDALEQALRSMSNEVDGVRSGLRYKISGQEQIAARLKDVVEQLAKEANATGAMRDGLEQIIARYEQAESSNRERTVADGTTIQQDADGSSGAGTGTDIWDRFKEALEVLLDPEETGRLPGPISAAVPWLIQPFYQFTENDGEADNPWFKIKGELDNKHEGEGELWDYEKKKDVEDFPYQKHYYKDLETGEIIEVDPNRKEDMEALKKHSKGTIPVDLTVAGIGVSGSAAIFDNDFGGKYDWGGHEGNVSVGKIEGHADAYLGALAVGAEVGASITAFSAKEKAYLGTEDFNLYGEASVTAGRAEAKAGASAGLLDKEGNFNPSAYVGASAEAIAGEITGKAGVDIAGVDVGVEGSLNVGVGAHANVGLHDGKLSVDIGASLGVGASIKLEVDVSGAIDAMADTADAIWSGVTNLFNW